MSKGWLQIEKFGDLISTLPILHSEFLSTGQPQNFIVHREYASVVEGLDYVTPIIYDGPMWDFKAAYKFAKSKFNHIEVPQVQIQSELGKAVEVERKTPSCFLERWRRVGYLEKWDTLPLILPRTSKTTLSGPTIFYADHSQSSPFFEKESLFKLLQDTFPTHQIMRASGMRLKNLRDFLPIMDASDLIVSVETSFLHLSKATVTPTVAMVADAPDPWRGSPYSKHFEFHCRYGDFESRKQELVAAMVRAVNKCKISEPEIVHTWRKNGYNMTLWPTIGCIYRYHPNESWKTNLCVADKSGLPVDILFPKECDGLSMEDARFFELGGNPHISYTCSRSEGGKWCSIQAYGELKFNSGNWCVEKHIVPKYGKNDFSTMEKNWCPFVVGGRLFFIYGNLKASMEQVILQMDGDKVVKEHRSPAPAWQYGGIRGGCVIPFKGHLLRMFHSRTGDTNKPLGFRYYIGASLMESEPPFKTVAVSTFPILAGNEKWIPNCHHVKRNVAICYGAIQDGDGFVISGGLNDAESFTMKLSVSDLNL